MQVAHDAFAFFQCTFDFGLVQTDGLARELIHGLRQAHIVIDEQASALVAVCEFNCILWLEVGDPQDHAIIGNLYAVHGAFARGQGDRIEDAREDGFPLHTEGDIAAGCEEQLDQCRQIGIELMLGGGADTRAYPLGEGIKSGKTEYHANGKCPGRTDRGGGDQDEIDEGDDGQGEITTPHDGPP